MMQYNSSATSNAEQVSEVNYEFYQAFLQRDFEGLAACWEHSERTVCIHPGKAPLRGWTAIGSSWQRRLEQSEGTLTTVAVNLVSVVVANDTAWVTGDVDLISTDGAVAVASMNIFARHGDSWLMVTHHASAIVGSELLSGHES